MTVRVPDSSSLLVTGRHQGSERDRFSMFPGDLRHWLF